MPLFSFYPTRDDGVSLTFETADLADKASALTFANRLLEAHDSAAEVVVFADWEEGEALRVERHDIVSLARALRRQRDDLPADPSRRGVEAADLTTDSGRPRC